MYLCFFTVHKEYKSLFESKRLLFNFLRELDIVEMRGLTTLLLSHTAVTSQGIIDFCASSPPPALAGLDLSSTQVTHAILPALHGGCILCQLFSTCAYVYRVANC